MFNFIIVNNLVYQFFPGYLSLSMDLKHSLFYGYGPWFEDDNCFSICTPDWWIATVRSWKTVPAKSPNNCCLMASTPGESLGSLASNTPFMTEALLILGGYWMFPIPFHMVDLIS